MGRTNLEDKIGGQNGRRRLSETRGGWVDWRERGGSGLRFGGVIGPKLGEKWGVDGVLVVVLVVTVNMLLCGRRDLNRYS